jgi:hypothetical protein
MKEDGRSWYVVHVVKVKEAYNIMVPKCARRHNRRCEYFIKIWL